MVGTDGWRCTARTPEELEPLDLRHVRFLLAIASGFSKTTFEIHLSWMSWLGEYNGVGI